MKTKHEQRVPFRFAKMTTINGQKLFVCFDETVGFNTRYVTLRFVIFGFLLISAVKLP